MGTPTERESKPRSANQRFNVVAAVIAVVAGLALVGSAQLQIRLASDLLYCFAVAAALTFMIASSKVVVDMVIPTGSPSKFFVGAILLLSIIILIESTTLRGRLSPQAELLVGPLWSASAIVLLITIAVVLLNMASIIDWFRLRVPPVVHDDVLGDLTYRNGVWSTRPARGASVWMFGRRIGPDAELVQAAARDWPNVIAMEAEARAFAERSGTPAAGIGPLNALQPLWTGSKRDRSVIVLLEFGLVDEVDVLDVIFRDGKPVEVDIH